MSKYRKKKKKKPVVIEAFEFTKEHRHNESAWPVWLQYAWQKDVDVISSMFPFSDGTDEVFISTLEGDMRVSFGDFIIQGVSGELYPCKPDIFHLTYERVDERGTENE